MNVQITPELHWSDNILYWGRLCLVAIFKIESYGDVFYELRGIAFEDWLIGEGEGLWMDGEGSLRIPDNGNIHDLIIAMYRNILSLGDYTANIQATGE